MFRTPFCWKPLLSWQRRSAHLPALYLYASVFWRGPLGRALLFKMVGKKTEHKNSRQLSGDRTHPSEVVETGLAQGTSSGYDAEARAFGELAMTPQSQALRSIFFLPVRT
ncbi:hypothetical protein KZ770_12475 [Escherichia coli]|nr:hypothetical protein [Escherichia coli]